MTDARSLRASALSGIKWNSIGQFGRQSLVLLLSIVLARLLTPRDFGLIAMLVIFQEIANALLNSGLNAPLIQNKHISAEDCSTVFYFNVGVALLCYGALVAGAEQLAQFYREPQLAGLVEYYGLVFLIHSFGNVQLGLIVRSLDYKRLNLIDLVGVAVSGSVAVLMALRGFGVWSLLGQHISYALTATALYWITSEWRPLLAFSGASFRRLFGLGSKVLVVSLMDKILGSVDHLVVGKIQGAAFLGQYNRAKSTSDLPAAQLNTAVTSLVFPVFSRIENAEELRRALSRFVGVISCVSAPVMVGIAMVAEPLIIVLYSAKWMAAVPLLRLFCLFGITIPLNSILVQTLMSRGGQGAFLKVEMLKKAVLLVSIAVGAWLGPVGLVLAMGLAHYLNLALTIRLVAGQLDIAAWAIVKDILPSVLLALLMGLPLYLLNGLPWPSKAQQLAASVAVGVVTYVGLSELFRSRDYAFVKEIVRERLLRASRLRDGVA